MNIMNFQKMMVFGIITTFATLCSCAYGAKNESAPAPLRAQEAGTLPVFANYMVCYATYGESVEGYQREMREAQSAGIDGFALDIGAWQNEPYYVKRTAMIFQAAKELNTGFKIIFCLEVTKPEYILEMIKTYIKHPNYYQYKSHPLLTTFSCESVDWKSILKSLRSEGYDVCFVPFFYPRPNVTELPSYAAAKEHFAKWNDVVDGYFFFGAAGTDEELTACNANYLKAAREDHKLCMSSFSPFYWGTNQPPGRRYFETRGGEGMERQWRSIIATQPDFVQIVTWNDFKETYLAPVVNPGQYSKSLDGPYRHNHAGYFELCKYYIAWYKTGKQPAITQDALFYFYRVHAKGAVIAKQPESAPDWSRKPVTDLHGDVQDMLYLTTILTEPAELRVTSGGTDTRYQVGKGIMHTRVPFKAGPQHFELYRDQKRLLTLDGEPIQANPDHYNFFPTTGFTYAK